MITDLGMRENDAIHAHCLCFYAILVNMLGYVKLLMNIYESSTKHILVDFIDKKV